MTFVASDPEGTLTTGETEGGLAGRITGPVNAGRTKAGCLAVLVGGARVTAAYGDTLADVHMLEMSEEPVAVFPGPRLRAEAFKRGWRVLAENKSQGRTTR